MEPIKSVESFENVVGNVDSISSLSSTASTNSSLPEYNASQVFFSLFIDEKGHNTYKNTSKCNRKMVLTYDVGKIRDYGKVHKTRHEIDDDDEKINEFKIPSTYRLNRKNSMTQMQTYVSGDRVIDAVSEEIVDINDVVIDMSSMRLG